jgi:Protein of unknown function (DUF3738)
MRSRLRKQVRLHKEKKEFPIYALVLAKGPLKMLRSAVLRGANLPPEAQKLLDASPSSALSDALQQVGLKLESRKTPLDALVIDSALKTSTAN